jgi:hypothetical protein
MSSYAVVHLCPYLSLSPITEAEQEDHNVQLRGFLVQRNGMAVLHRVCSWASSLQSEGQQPAWNSTYARNQQPLPAAGGDPQLPARVYTAMATESTNIQFHGSENSNTAENELLLINACKSTFDIIYSV